MNDRDHYNPSQKSLLTQPLCWCLVANPSTRLRRTSGLRPTKRIRSDGESSNAGKLGPAARVPAKPLGEDGILNQNPIFEMGSNRGFQPEWLT
jgi:hypothetical protein